MPAGKRGQLALVEAVSQGCYPDRHVGNRNPSTWAVICCLPDITELPVHRVRQAIHRSVPRGKSVLKGKNVARGKKGRRH